MVGFRIVRAAATAIVCLLVTVQADTQSAPKVPTVRGYEETQAWFRQVRAHDIGQTDGAVKAVAAYSPLTLQTILADVRYIRDAVRAFGEGLPAPTVSGSRRGPVFPLIQLGPLLGLSDDELQLPFNIHDLAKPDNPARLAISRVMIRAAFLHTQIAMTTANEPRANLIWQGSRVVVNQPSVVRLQDGKGVGVADTAIHWSIAREAMELVGLPPESSPVVRAWYRGTIAYMQADRNYSTLMPQLSHARDVMKGDPGILLFSGAASENLAAPVIQVALEEAGQRVSLDTPANLLAAAEQFLRQALEAQSDFAEARLRLGRVLDLRGRHEEAAGLLRLAEAGLATPARRYYAALFLGRAEQARDRAPEARAAFERAMVLFPRAQSARLAIADLQWRSGDEAAAVAGVNALFATIEGAGREADPWWVYDVSHVGDLQAQLADMYRTARAAVQ